MRLFKRKNESCCGKKIKPTEKKNLLKKNKKDGNKNNK